MAEDRMLSDEILLGLIKANSGGGGGGTDDYNDLKNQPKINNNTLVGNKTASDLGLVAAVDGKGLSTNDYTDADKAIVGGVTASLAGKQGTLTAGKYIGIDANNEISVEREIPDEAFTYTIQQTGDGIVKITKTVNGAVVFEETYSGDVDVTLDALRYVYSSGVQSYTLLIASDTHEAGFKQVMSWWQRNTYTENFSTIDHSGEKLVIKSEMDAALANKQDKTDNNLDTEAKTIVGAINEHEGDIDSLKSGLTNVQGDVKLNTNDLTTPSRTKNLLPMTLNGIKSANTAGTWSGNAYTANDLTFTVQMDDDGKNITSIIANGTASNNTYFHLSRTSYQIISNCILNGCPSGGSAFESYSIIVWQDGSIMYSDEGNGRDIPAGITINDVYIRISSGQTITSKVFYPMLRYASITDSTFAPYIPSVESRIETIEGGNISGLTLGKIPHTRYAFNSANTSLEITIPTYKAYFGIAHHPWAENAGDIVIINSASAGNLGCYQTSNVFTITKNGNVLTLTNGASPMYLDLYEITP